MDGKSIKALLTAAMSAPSARNLQSWRFVVVTGRAILDELMTVHPYANLLKKRRWRS